MLIFFLFITHLRKLSRVIIFPKWEMILSVYQKPTITYWAGAGEKGVREESFILRIQIYRNTSDLFRK